MDCTRLTWSATSLKYGLTSALAVHSAAIGHRRCNGAHAGSRARRSHLTPRHPVANPRSNYLSALVARRCNAKRGLD